MHPDLCIILKASGFVFNHFTELRDTGRLVHALRRYLPVKGWARPIHLSFEKRDATGSSSASSRTLVGAIELDGTIYSLRGSIGWEDIKTTYLEDDVKSTQLPWETYYAHWEGKPQPIRLQDDGERYAQFQKGVSHWQALRLQSCTKNTAGHSVIHRL